MEIDPLNLLRADVVVTSHIPQEKLVLKIGSTVFLVEMNRMIKNFPETSSCRQCVLDARMCSYLHSRVIVPVSLTCGFAYVDE